MLANLKLTYDRPKYLHPRYEVCWLVQKVLIVSIRWLILISTSASHPHLRAITLLIRVTAASASQVTIAALGRFKYYGAADESYCLNLDDRMPMSDVRI